MLFVAERRISSLQIEVVNNYACVNGHVSAKLQWKCTQLFWTTSIVCSIYYSPSLRESKND